MEVILRLAVGWVGKGQVCSGSHAGSAPTSHLVYRRGLTFVSQMSEYISR